MIPQDEFNLWIGVSDMMREQERERIHTYFEVLPKWMHDRQVIDTELVIREGELVPEILAQVRDDSEIGVLVFGLGTGKKGAVLLVTQLTKNSGSLLIPITIVPSDLPKERLEAIA